MPTPLNFYVWGEPAPGQGGKEQEWREAIEAKAKKVREENKLQALKATRFHVSIEFLINEPQLSIHENGADLDNMAKPVIDTLFKQGSSVEPKTKKPTGVLFNINDKQVFELIMKKRLPNPEDEEKEGAKITITWN